MSYSTKVGIIKCTCLFCFAPESLIKRKYDISVQNRKMSRLYCRFDGLSIHTKLSVNKTKYPAVDQSVFDWFYSLKTLRGTNAKLPVSRDLIKASAIYEAKKCSIAAFHASDGWFSRWRRRYNITKCVRLHREAREVDMKAAELQMNILEMLSKDMIQTMFLIWVSQVSFSEPSPVIPI